MFLGNNPRERYVRKSDQQKYFFLDNYLWFSWFSITTLYIFFLVVHQEITKEKSHKTTDNRCRHYVRERFHSWGKPSKEKLFLSILFFETLHPLQRPDLPPTSSQPPRPSTSFQQLRLGNRFWHWVASDISETWNTLISQSRAQNRERGTKFAIFFFSLDSTQLALILAS